MKYVKICSLIESKHKQTKEERKKLEHMLYLAFKDAFDDDKRDVANGKH